MRQYYSNRSDNRVLLTILIVLSAAAVFILDAVTPVDVSVSSLYVFVVLVASFAYRARGILLVGVACEVLTLISHYLSPGETWGEWPLVDRAITVVGVAMSTLLVMRNRTASETLEQSEAYLAEAQQLSHTGSV